MSCLRVKLKAFVLSLNTRVPVFGQFSSPGKKGFRKSTECLEQSSGLTQPPSTYRVPCGLGRDSSRGGQLTSESPGAQGVLRIPPFPQRTASRTVAGEVGLAVGTRVTRGPVRREHPASKHLPASPRGGPETGAALCPASP